MVSVASILAVFWVATALFHGDASPEYWPSLIIANIWVAAHWATRE